MGNGLTTKLRAQWFLDSTLETHNTVITIPTVTGSFLLASLILSVIEILRRVK
jgi:hypothetical protein